MASVIVQEPMVVVVPLGQLNRLRDGLFPRISFHNSVRLGFNRLAVVSLSIDYQATWVTKNVHFSPEKRLYYVNEVVVDNASWGIVIPDWLVRKIIRA